VSIDEVVRNGVPGVAVLRRVDGAVEVAAAGMADLATSTPVTTETAFRTGSIAKPFVATVLLQLVDEGTVGLDDTIDQWLPGAVPGGDGITVRQLLGNRSGLFDFIADPQVLAPYLAGEIDHVWSPEDLVAVAAAHDPEFAPGTAALYSNTDYTVAGLIIERATSRPVAAEIEDRIIRPLALDRTAVPATAALVAPYAHGYAPDSAMQDVTAVDPSVSSFGGNLVSTLGDLSTFLDALFGGRLLSPELLHEMMTTTDSLSGEQLGLGLQALDLPCGRFIGHSGSTPGYKAAAFQAVDGDRQFVIMVNSVTQTDSVGSPEAAAAFDAAVNEAACGPASA
jgi:D-alanyl-D-alanine carboxypeptidase